MRVRVLLFKLFINLKLLKFLPFQGDFHLSDFFDQNYGTESFDVKFQIESNYLVTGKLS